MPSTLTEKSDLLSAPVVAPSKTFQVDALSVRVFENRSAMARDAVTSAHRYLTHVLQKQGYASVILATGNSQIQFLDELTRLGGIDWSKITLFHMDEYLGLDAHHSASFRRYMKERVESKLRPKTFHYIGGDADEPIKECERYTALLVAQPIDLCCMGVGENGHIAFNDPHVADLNDPLKVKIVKLDRACQMQQVNEGHFPNLESVPPYALTLTIPMLCSAKKIICVAPEKRKAQAVKAMLEGPIGSACPATALRRQPQATLLLDQDSAALLKS